MLPERSEPVVALTARPEESEKDKQSSGYLTNALHRLSQPNRSVPPARLARMTAVVTAATITCPQCATATLAEMPIDACQFFYICPAYSSVLRPRAGDCCVFCSYSDQICPPKQTGATSR